MSFPRVVPLAKRKINKRIRNLVLRGSIIYTVGVAGIGEYFGFWERLNIGLYDNNEHQTFENLKEEDEKVARSLASRGFDKSINATRKFFDEAFVESLPMGIKHVIKDSR